jgi:hypothetical protein
MTHEPAPPPPPPGYGYYPPQPAQESSTSAVTALVLGILSFVACGPFTAIPAIIVGRNAMREIDASQGRLGGRGMAQAGYVLGIIGTILGVIGLIVVLLLFVGIFATGAHIDGTVCHVNNHTTSCTVH